MEDEERRIVLTNARFLTLFEIPATPDQLIGTDCSTAAEDSKHLFKDPEGFVSRISDILARRRLTIGDQLEMVDGTYLSRDYVPVFEDNEYLGHMWVYRDVTEQQRARKQLEELALTDELMQLLNRRGFGIRFSVELERARRTGEELSLVVTDIDRFKRYNDRFGHGAGDEALKMFADSLVASTRQLDIVGRYGGEEFVMLLVGAGRERASKVIERARESLRKQPWSREPVTASFGVITHTAEATDLSDLTVMAQLLEAADKALYAAKEAGRDCVIHAEDLTIE